MRRFAIPTWCDLKLGLTSCTLVCGLLVVLEPVQAQTSPTPSQADFYDYARVTVVVEPECLERNGLLCEKDRWVIGSCEAVKLSVIVQPYRKDMAVSLEIAEQRAPTIAVQGFKWTLRASEERRLPTMIDIGTGEQVSYSMAVQPGQVLNVNLGPPDGLRAVGENPFGMISKGANWSIIEFPVKVTSTWRAITVNKREDCN